MCSLCTEGRHHHPQWQSRCCPLSEANTPLLHNLRRSRAPFFVICGVSRHHNSRPKRPSNLRTLRPIGPVNPKNPPRPAASAPFGTAYHLSARSSVGRQKESALMGRLGALLRPTWRSYAGPPQWHNKPQIPAELSPHPLQIYDSFTLHRIIMCYYNSNKLLK